MCEEEIQLPWSSVYPTRIWIRRLMILAFIPTEDVIEAFFRILDDIPNTDRPRHWRSPGILPDQSDPGTNNRLRNRTSQIPSVHVECLWAQPLEPDKQRGGVLEQLKFSALVGHANPTIYNFIAAVQMEQSSTDKKILANSLGEHGRLRGRRPIATRIGESSA